MKSAMAIKPPETALWARRIFSAPMSAKTAGRKIAMAFRRFAKQARLVASGQMSEAGSQPTFDLRSLISGARIWFYGLALRFKRCDMPPKAQSLRPKAFSVFHRTERTAPRINF